MCDFPAVATFFLYCFARKGIVQYRFERILSFNSYFLYNPYFSETKRFRYHYSRYLFVVLFYLAVVFHIYIFICFIFFVIGYCPKICVNSIFFFSNPSGLGERGFEKKKIEFTQIFGQYQWMTQENAANLVNILIRCDI